MSTHNIGFYEDLTKIIIELSSNTHLISSAAFSLTMQWYTILLFIYEPHHEGGSSTLGSVST